MTFAETYALYRRQCDAFCEAPPDDPDEYDRIAEATFLRTRNKLVATTILTPDDATAATIFITGELGDGAHPHDVSPVVASLIGYIRGESCATH